MPLLNLGLNHTTAPVEIRERVVFEPADLDRALAGLAELSGIGGGVIVSTCNRTEIYCVLDSPEHASTVESWFRQWHGLDDTEISAALYRYWDTDAVRHVLRVACGLDSMILGEPQIAGQLKDAWRAAITNGAAGPELDRLFQHAFAVSKEVRTHTDIGTSPVSVASAAITLAKQIFGELKPLTALMIGAGDMIELAARHLRGAGVESLLVANRDAQRADRVAEPLDGRGVPLARLGEVLHQADIVIASTASTLPILGKGAVEHALRQRRHRPMFMVDIAVPRDIEPEIGRLSDVYLYTVDDLQGVISDNIAARQEAAGDAEGIIAERVEEFLAWRRSLDSVGTIRDFREQAEDIRRRTLAQAQRMLEQGRAPEDALQFLAHTLTTRLIHNPTVAIRNAGRDERTELIDAARELFDLDEDASP